MDQPGLRMEQVAGVRHRPGPLSRQSTVRAAVHPTTSTSHPTPFTLHLTPYTLHPTPYTLHPTPYTLHAATYSLDDKPSFPLFKKAHSTRALTGHLRPKPCVLCVAPTRQPTSRCETIAHKQVWCERVGDAPLFEAKGMRFTLEM